MGVTQRIPGASSDSLLARCCRPNVALFAACRFLGELMRHLSRPTKAAMRAVVDADISDLGWAEAAQRIEDEMHAAVQDASRSRSRSRSRGRKPRAA